jgi:TfoX/Sxy family transcriptional regulator of competence genes
LKLSGDDWTALLAIEGSKPLQYEPDQPMSKSYVVVPEIMLSDPQHLREWVVRSAAGLAPKPKRKSKTT